MTELEDGTPDVRAQFAAIVAKGDGEYIRAADVLPNHELFAAQAGEVLKWHMVPFYRRGWVDWDARFVNVLCRAYKLTPRGKFIVQAEKSLRKPVQAPAPPDRSPPRHS